MAEQKKMVEAITSMEEDFAKWYTDIVKKAELMDYSSVRGCMIIEPYGWAIWENIRDILDHEFKELGHENVAMPLFIPESLLQKEKDHVEGFAPEVAWVTHGGLEELQERLCVRPTSETLFCDFYADFSREKAVSMLADLKIQPGDKISAMSKGTREKVQLVLVMSRAAGLYLLDEPIGGVDPATRDYILSTIIGNYNPEAAVIISTHLIADVEKVLDEVIFMRSGRRRA